MREGGQATDCDPEVCSTCGHDYCPGRFGNPAACWQTRGLKPIEVTTFADRKPRFLVYLQK